MNRPPDRLTRRTPGPAEARAFIKKSADTANQSHLTSFGPIDEAVPRVEAVTANLTKVLLGQLPATETIESSIVTLEAVARYLKVA